MSTLTAGLATSDSELRELRPEWERLWRRVPDATPFQSPDWLLPWWAQFGTGAPRVAVLRDADGLAGVLPLYVLDESPARKLLPIGAGITDYQDALLAPNAPPDAAGVLLSTVLDTTAEDGITCIDLIDVPGDARLREAVPGQEWRACDACPVLALRGGDEGLRESVPAEAHRKLRMNRHRAGRIGGAVVQAATPATLPAFLDALFRLHEGRWSGAGVLSDPRVRAFHREAAPLLLASGSLRLQVLSFGSTVAAACYALLAGPQRILFYLSGYDPDFASLSPGSLLLGAMLEEAVREGRTEAHFLRGGERYKYAWGAVDRVNAACRLEPR